MAEVKNAFIKSKMNKDLDDRLIPSGEYRNAVNVQVSKSEGSDVGALENVLGNSLIATFGGGVEGLSCVGFFTDESNSDIYVFLTDNITDSYTPRGIGWYPAEGSNHFIYKYNTQDNSAPILLVSGAFLNFSKLNPIYGVNLLEKLLFWTDNRNQPRKINVDSAEVVGYYTTEEQISVAKYYPYEVINLFKRSTLAEPRADGSLQYESTMKNVDDQFLPNGGSCVSDTTVTNSSTIVAEQISIPFYPKIPVTGMRVDQVDSTGEIIPLKLNNINQSITVSGFTLPNALELSGNVDVSTDTVLIFNSNPYYSSKYPGDSNLNKDKFIRFSYRFKFSDGEYSLIAPFTQVCFIPTQDGYFMTDNLSVAGGAGTANRYEGDMSQAYSSTVVDFMENKVDEISLQVPLPFKGSLLNSSLHVDEIDILYKESDGLAIQVVETIKVSDLSENTSNTYEYIYQSQKPYKTLPSKEITRVYDKVPVKALGQEIISNRVVYSNYQDKHTPPASLNYNVSANVKSDFSLGNGEGVVTSNVSNDTIIPITMQHGVANVGAVLTSPQGSPGLSVTILETSGLPVNSLTVSQPVTFVSNDFLTFEPAGEDSNATSIVEYPNSSLKTNRNYQVGVVLSDKLGRQSTVILSNSKVPISAGSETYVGSTIYSPYTNADPFSWVGNSLKMLFNEGIALEGPNPATREPGLYNGDVYSESYNPLGWYSYKIVVKQTEQEYYNVYTAGATLGLPYNYDDPSSVTALQKNTSFVTLVNDNINKIPRDLSEVGPQDKSFRSSVTLYGRVENTLVAPSAGDMLNTNRQFYPGRTSFTTSSIEPLFDIFQTQEFTGSGTAVIPVTDTANAFSSFYKSDSNPFIAQITTSQNVNKQFGFKNTLIGSSSSDYKNIAALAVFETKPVESKLDIFWETSTSGLLSGLNALVLNEGGGASGISTWNISPFLESLALNASILDLDFTPVDSFGTNIDPAIIQSLSMTVTNNNGLNVTPYFTLVNNAPGYYNVKVTQGFIDNVYFGSNVNLRNFVFTFTLQLNPDPAEPLPSPSIFNKLAALSNVVPTIDAGQGDSSDNDFFVSTTSFANHFATNGAHNSNPNKYDELQWSLTPVSPVSQPYFDLAFSVDQGNVPIASIVRTIPSTSHLSGGSFSMDLKVTDAGGSGLEDIFSVDMNTIAPLSFIKNIETAYYPYDTSERTEYFEATLFEVNFTKTPASTLGNGWYVYTGYFAGLSNNDPLVDVAIDRTGASLTDSITARWFFGSTRSGVLQNYNMSIADIQWGSFSEVEYAIPNIGAYTMVVK